MLPTVCAFLMLVHAFFTCCSSSLVVCVDSHENLLPLVGYSLSRDLPCLVYPLMAGGNLEDRLLLTAPALERLRALADSTPAAAAAAAESGLAPAAMDTAAGAAATIVPLPWQQRLLSLRDATRALVYLHTPLEGREPLLHRDVKATNILIDAHGNTKLSDVGLAKAAPGLRSEGTAAGGCAHSRTFHPTHVSTLHLLGTPGFIDPEILNSGRYSPASDAFAMGVVLLMALTGREALAAREVAEDMDGADESTVKPHTDATAKWPDDELPSEIAQMGLQLTHPRKRQRLALPRALATLERLAEVHGVRPGVALAAVSPAATASSNIATSPTASGIASEAEEPSSARVGALRRQQAAADGGGAECVMCMAELRTTGFGCGCDDVCCALCADELTGRLCPVCRQPIAEHGLLHNGSGGRGSADAGAGTGADDGGAGGGTNTVRAAIVRVPSPVPVPVPVSAADSSERSQTLQACQLWLTRREASATSWRESVMEETSDAQDQERSVTASV